MSVQKIIQESINENPLEMKEALAEELRNRVAEAISAKMEEAEQIDEISKSTLGSYIKKAADNKAVNDRYAGRTGDRESYAISDKRDQGIKRAVDKLTKEEVEDLDEVSRKTLASYVKKAAGVGQHNTLPNAMRDRATAAAIGDKEWYKQSGRTADKRSKGIQKAADRLAKD